MRCSAVRCYCRKPRRAVRADIVSGTGLLVWLDPSGFRLEYYNNGWLPRLHCVSVSFMSYVTHAVISRAKAGA